MNLIKYFENYEMCSGRVSLIRFKNYILENCNNKRNLNKILKYLENFELDVINNNYYIRKDYFNFRLYVLEKIK